MSCNPLDPKNHSSAIVDGPVGGCKTGLVLTPPALYFGAAVVGEDPLTLSFKVKNQGYKTLRIENVELQGAKFTLLGSAPALLKGDAEFEMQVEYTSNEVGTFNGMVLIYTNEREEPYVLGLSGRIIGSTYIEAMFGEFQALVLEESYARADADSAEAGHRLTLQASLETADTLILARVVQEEVARVDGDSAEAFARQTLTADYNETKASLETEISVRSTQYEALAQSIESLEATFIDEGEIEAIAQAKVDIEATARANADSAEALLRQAISARLNNFDGSGATAEARYTAEQTARVNADNAEAALRQAITTRLNNINGTGQSVEASFINEETARVNADNAEAILRQAITARLNNWNGTGQTGEAAVAAAAGAYVTPLSAEATLRQAISARLDNWNGTGVSGEAALTNEQTARVNADNAEATLRAAISARLNAGGDVYASIQSAATAYVTPLGAEVIARQTLSTNVFGAGGLADTQASVNTDLYGRTDARIVNTVIGSGGKAEVEIYSNADTGAGIRLVGNVEIHGNLLVTGSVNTPQITPNAVSNSVLYKNKSPQLVNPASGNAMDTVFASVAINCAGNYIALNFSAYYDVSYSGGQTSYLVVYRDGIGDNGSASPYYVDDCFINKWYGALSYFFIDDSCPPGPHTYYFTLQGAYAPGNVYNRTVLLQEFKR